MVTIYHNPRCSKSRQALTILQSKNIELNIVLYLDARIDQSLLESLLFKLGLSAAQIIRRNENDFKRLRLDAKDINEQQLLAAMVKYPKLIERPIVVNGQKAIVGRPPEKILEIL
ncbi:MAG TPA: arsenate reductase (glutaredoxin) [Porticoccaceae bacterium]|jgi:arsenate reductase|nr:arsenate reductase (glutaredoxin) [Porticoccaceae bacterium]